MKHVLEDSLKIVILVEPTKIELGIVILGNVIVIQEPLMMDTQNNAKTAIILGNKIFLNSKN